MNETIYGAPCPHGMPPMMCDTCERDRLRARVAELEAQLKCWQEDCGTLRAQLAAATDENVKLHASVLVNRRLGEELEQTRAQLAAAQAQSFSGHDWNRLLGERDGARNQLAEAARHVEALVAAWDAPRLCGMYLAMETAMDAARAWLKSKGGGR